MQPSIILQIKNNIPQVIFMSSPDNKKEITESKEDLNDIIQSLATELNILNESERTLNNLLEYARESDDLFLNPFVEIDSKAGNFQINEAVEQQLSKAKDQSSDFSEYGKIDKNVKEELKKNQNADIFASILDTIYNVLIAKTILHASELGIGQIYLDDETDNKRLREKMAKELDELGIELLIFED